MSNSDSIKCEYCGQERHILEISCQCMQVKQSRKAVVIIIENVDGSRESDACIAELSRAGCPKGSRVNATYIAENNSCKFTTGKYDCVAYVGETCKIVKE